MERSQTEIKKPWSFWKAKGNRAQILPWNW